MAVAGSWQPPRPCEVYRAEWELCRSAGHVLYHYYVHGERPDCRQWLRDLTSCREWEESRSAEAQESAEEESDVVAVQQVLRALGPSREAVSDQVSFVQRSLCESEQTRVQAAQKHTLIWALRKRPPADWNLPLPQDKD